MRYIITLYTKDGVSQDIILFCWVAIFKSFFPVKRIASFFNKVYICLFTMLNSSFIWGKIKSFKDKFDLDYLMMIAFVLSRKGV